MIWVVLFVAWMLVHSWLEAQTLYPLTPVLWLTGAGIVAATDGPEIAFWIFYTVFWTWLISVRTANDAPLQVHPSYTNGVRNTVGIIGLAVGGLFVVLR